MPLKKSQGNMYPWVTHTHSILSGQCPHRCAYCYVQAMGRRFPNLRARYSGPVMLDADELTVNYGADKTIFIEHQNDLFAKEVPSDWIADVLRHCRRFPKNKYVFQTKNPIRMRDWLSEMPPDRMLGTTIETNRRYEVMGNAPATVERFSGMQTVTLSEVCFVTVEPILDFDTELFVWLIDLMPDFVNIGADSKGYGLPEPGAEKVKRLIAVLDDAGIEIRRKTNLSRILNTK